MKKNILLIFLIFIFFGCTPEQNKITEEKHKLIIPKTEQNAVSKDLEDSENPEETLPLDAKIIVVDAGHGIADYSKKEQIAPESSETKPAFVSGTSGKNQTEEQLNLKVAKKLEKLLSEMGATVYMTRTEAQTTMSNIDRAEYANRLDADISVKLHADGSDNSSIKGISMLIPSKKYIPDNIYMKSQNAGKIILDEVLKTTGANDKGVVERSDMTGFNWSKVPVILLEMGFMSNPEEDALLESDEYQQKIVQGIANGLVIYFQQ